jgi:hypothetical protein
MLSSEIEVAIKIGKAVYLPYDLDSKELINTLNKLDIDLSQRPYHNTHLSQDLRTLVEHKGDVSFQRFIEEHLKDIKDSAPGGFNELYAKQQLKFFLRGIFYLYPASSARHELASDCTWGALNVSSVDEILDYADTVIEDIKIRQEAIERIRREKELNG